MWVEILDRVEVRGFPWEATSEYNAEVTERSSLISVWGTSAHTKQTEVKTPKQESVCYAQITET